MVQRTVTYEDFSNGIDLSRGRYPDDPKILRTAENVVLTSGRKIKCAPPVDRLDVELDDQTQGLVYAGCQLVTFARAGDTIVNEGPDADQVQVLYWDVPPYCDGDWELLAATVYRNQVFVSIRHTFPGCDFDSVVWNHILDPAGAPRVKPTYVEDPWCPTDWFQSRPLHLFGKGEIGSYYPDWTPAHGIGAEKFLLSQANGDFRSSITGDARYWSPLSAADLADFGQSWMWLTPNNGETLLNFLVSDRYDSLDNDRAFTGYVAEWLDSDGRWQKFIEVDATPTIPGTYHVRPLPSSYADYDEICLEIRWEGAACTWIRWRALTGGPSITLTDGGDYVDNWTPGSADEMGDGGKTQFQTAVDTTDFRLHYAVKIERDDGQGGNQDIPLILGQGLHYTISDYNDTARIDFSRYKGQVLERCLVGGQVTVASEYTTDLLYDTLRYVGAFLPTLFLNEAADVVVDPADYQLVNDDGYIRVEWIQNLPAAGTVFWLKFAPLATDKVIWASEQRHFTGGTYLFEDSVWQFSAVGLGGLPTEADVIAGIPHFPLLFGASGIGGGQGNDVFTTPGSFPWEVPAGITEIAFQGWGAGGGGGGARYQQDFGTFLLRSGGGGGGGGYFAGTIPVTPGEILTVEVGAGGTAGASSGWTLATTCGGSGASGGTGGQTRLLRGATVLVEINGGAGGTKGGGGPGSGGAGGAVVTPAGGLTGANGGNGTQTFNYFSWPAPPYPQGGAGGLSGSGDTNGQGGNGAESLPNQCPPTPAGNDGRVAILYGTQQEPWFDDSAAPSMPLDGYERYNLLILKRFTTDGSGQIVGDLDYVYGNEAGQESNFYIEKQVYYNQIAGDGDATLIESSAKGNACTDVVAISSIQNRVAIHYEQQTLLYQFEADPQQNRFLDHLHFGSRGDTAEFFGGIMLLTQESFRAMDLDGLNWDSLADNNYGRPVQRVPVEAIYDAVYWPALGSYVAQVLIDGEIRFILFRYSSESRVAGWSVRIVRDLTQVAVDSMHPVDDRCYFRTENRVRYLITEPEDGLWWDDVDEDAYQAAVDAAGTDENIYREDYMFRGLVRFHLNDMGQAATMKRWQWMDVEQEGDCRAYFYEQDVDPETDKRTIGPSFQGTSLIRRRTGIVKVCQALSVELERLSIEGWELDRVVLGVAVHRR